MFKFGTECADNIYRLLYGGFIQLSNLLPDCGTCCVARRQSLQIYLIRMRTAQSRVPRVLGDTSMHMLF